MNAMQQVEEYLQSNNTIRLHAHKQKITELINELLDGLYIPIDNNPRGIRDRNLLRELGIFETEPINWAKLYIKEVSHVKDNFYLVFINNALPNQCPTFSSYLRNKMEEAGYFVDITLNWE